MNFAMATLGLKEMGKFLQTYGSHSKVGLESAKKKSGIMKSGLDAMPLFLLDDLLMRNLKKIWDYENWGGTPLLKKTQNIVFLAKWRI